MPLKGHYPVTEHAPNFDFWTGCREIKRCEKSKRTLKNPFASRLAEFDTTLKLLRITEQWYIVPVEFRFGRNRDQTFCIERLRISAQHRFPIPQSRKDVCRGFDWLVSYAVVISPIWIKCCQAENDSARDKRDWARDSVKRVLSRVGSRILHEWFAPT